MVFSSELRLYHPYNVYYGDIMTQIIVHIMITFIMSEESPEIATITLRRFFSIIILRTIRGIGNDFRHFNLAMA